MLGLAHRGWRLNDYGQHWVHTLRRAGYRSILIGEQHISIDPGVIGYDEVVEVDSTPRRRRRAADDRGAARARRAEPWFMSVGFFETHRDFFAPTSVRDTLYSLPPANLPDTPATRARHGRVQGQRPLARPGHRRRPARPPRLRPRRNTLVICTTDHGIAFPGAKATLYDRGIGVMMIMRGPGGFTGGKVIDAPVSHLDVYPTLCELAGVEQPDWLQGTSLMPLVRGEVDAPPRGDLRRDDLPRRLRAAARRSGPSAGSTSAASTTTRIRCSPTATTATARTSWSRPAGASRSSPEEQLYDLVLDPGEGNNLRRRPGAAPRCWRRCASGSRTGCSETEDPLLDGPVAPPGAPSSTSSGRSRPTTRCGSVTADPTAAPSS